jgi:predicted nucleotide-binding protein (sugar kinase/HSP70/actin superfamily)
MVKIGIPRALLYYQYYPMWKVFFERLGVQIVVSPSTNKSILNLGVSRGVQDTCLPVKVFFGHAISLANECDLLFIPAVTSLGKKIYNCSKLIGLPNMVRALIPECPPILAPEINYEKGRYNLYRNIYDVGHYFTSNPFKLRKVVEESWRSNLDFRNKMSDEGITPFQAIDCQPLPDIKSSSLTVAVIGHPYIIYDEYISHRLISRLQQMEVKVVTPEMIPERELDAATRRLVGIPHWSFETDIIGAGEYYLEMKVDGIITVSAFGCGPDSMMLGIVQHRAREFEIPLLPLSLDEHSSEGGLLTRLEAFLDMLRRRGKVCV